MVSYLATAAIAASLMAVMPAAPQWEADYGKALKETRADDQPLLIVLEDASEAATDVQQVAHVADATTPQEAEKLAPYQLCKVDVSTEYGQRVAKAFGATSFPYTAIIDRSGSVILYSKTGSHDKSEWSTVLATYKSGDREDAVLASTSSSSTSPVMFRKPYETVTSEPTCTSCQKGYCPSCQQNRGY